VNMIGLELSFTYRDMDNLPMKTRTHMNRAFRVICILQFFFAVTPSLQHHSGHHEASCCIEGKRLAEVVNGDMISIMRP
jgi:hypothetical protein